MTETIELRRLVERLCVALERFIEIWESEIARRTAIEQRYETKEGADERDLDS